MNYSNYWLGRGEGEKKERKSRREKTAPSLLSALTPGGGVADKGLYFSSVVRKKNGGGERGTDESRRGVPFGSKDPRGRGTACAVGL